MHQAREVRRLDLRSKYGKASINRKRTVAAKSANVVYTDLLCYQSENELIRLFVSTQRPQVGIWDQFAGKLMRLSKYNFSLSRQTYETVAKVLAKISAFEAEIFLDQLLKIVETHRHPNRNKALKAVYESMARFWRELLWFLLQITRKESVRSAEPPPNPYVIANESLDLSPPKVERFLPFVARTILRETNQLLI